MGGRSGHGKGGLCLEYLFFVVLWVGRWDNRQMIYRIREGLRSRAMAVSSPAD